MRVKYKNNALILPSLTACTLLSSHLMSIFRLTLRLLYDLPGIFLPKHGPVIHRIITRFIKRQGIHLTEGHIQRRQNNLHVMAPSGHESPIRRHRKSFYLQFDKQPRWWISHKYCAFPNSVPQSRHRLEVADPSPQSIYCKYSQNCKTMSIKLKVLYSAVFTLLKAWTTMSNIFLSHSYILVFPPKSLFSITLTLIFITLSLVTLLIGNHFSFWHFIALHYKRNVISTCSDIWR